MLSFTICIQEPSGLPHVSSFPFAHMNWYWLMTSEGRESHNSSHYSTNLAKWHACIDFLSVAVVPVLFPSGTNRRVSSNIVQQNYTSMSDQGKIFLNRVKILTQAIGAPYSYLMRFSNPKLHSFITKKKPGIFLPSLSSRRSQVEGLWSITNALT